jgi:hypothetical protein
LGDESRMITGPVRRGRTVSITGILDANFGEFLF